MSVKQRLEDPKFVRAMEYVMSADLFPTKR